ncbi:diphthine--ammonia ligase [Leptobacterium flavescens]|uniref:Diphthine--ammonia ligase n=1 Tax=Leptobacterium flavescens TaxID=472055 RepID=A0A6P0UQI0_9FLAO|nr:diphthine--ammonia ligase [Leptobacterium flavescens]NER14079.1 diphthine--ammonia ligase [Leptobacterium flavescens]
MEKAYFNWSSGKDSSLALHRLLEEGKYDIVKLVTTVNTDYNRVSMHGLRNELLELQADAIGLPLHKIPLSGNVSMKEYDKVMKSQMELLKQQASIAVFGDIFLEDLKKYREERLSEVGIKAVFPLWKEDTKALIDEFLDLGFKAITVCVNAKLLGASFVGRVIDRDFIKELPENVDPCGENGEFHTFVFDGPIFKKAVPFKIGEKVHRTYSPAGDDDNCFSDEEKSWDTGFWYCDLLPQ